MSSEMRELVEELILCARANARSATEQGHEMTEAIHLSYEANFRQLRALLARTEAGADGAAAWLCEWTDEDDGETVRVSFEFKRGAENRALEVGGDARVIPLYTHPQDASGDAELIEAVGTYEEAVRLFGRTSPSASRAYCRMTDVLAAMQAKEPAE